MPIFEATPAQVKSVSEFLMLMIRKTTAVIIAALVLFFTVISLLAIWEIIDIKAVFQKSFLTLIVLFICAAIMLFIFSVLFKSGDENTPKPPPLG